jgi:lysophospholipase L1-like esterase
MAWTGAVRSLQALLDLFPDDSQAPKNADIRDVIASATATPTNVPGAANVSANVLRPWRVSRGSVASNSGTKRVLLIGDSITYGIDAEGSGSPNTLNRSGSYGRYLADILTANDLPATWGNFLGAGGLTTTGNVTTSDPRLAFGTGWIVYTPGAVGCAGGEPFRCDNPNTGSLGFTPTTAFDSIVVQYIAGTGNGTFTVKVDAGSVLATVNSNATPGVVTTARIATPLATGTVNIQRNGTGASIFICGVSCYDSTKSELQVLNAGIPSGTAGTAVTTGNSYSATNGRLQSFTSWDADLSIIMLGVNDIFTGVPLATYITQMQTIITNQLATGDVLLMIWPPTADSNVSVASQLPFRQAIADLATANGLACVDIPARWGSYEAGQSAGFYASVTHPNKTGYSDIARAVSGVLLA